MLHFYTPDVFRGNNETLDQSGLIALIQSQFNPFQANVLLHFNTSPLRKITV